MAFRTINHAPSLLSLFDSSTTVRCFRLKTITSADKVIRTGDSLEVRYSSSHTTHQGALVMLASSERKFMALSRITNIIDSSKFNIAALYPGLGSGNNVANVQVVFLNESSCTSWIQRALEHDDLAGAFRIDTVMSRGGRNGADVAGELRYIREALKNPSIVIGSLSSNNDLLDTSVNVATSISNFDTALRQLQQDGHQVAITNARPMDLSYGTTPNATQEKALLNLNIHFRDLARDNRSVDQIDWYSRFVDRTSSAGGARSGLYVDSVHFNTDGATEAGKDVAEYLLMNRRGKPGPLLRSGLWDGPARGNAAGCNICGALETNAAYTPVDSGFSGDLSTHVTMVGNGNLRTCVASLIQLVDNDNSYRQRLVCGGGNNQGYTFSIEGPTGDKIVSKLVAGGMYQIALRYALFDMNLVKSVQFIANGQITYPTIGALSGNFGAGMSHEGEGPADTPNLYYPNLPRSGVMEFPALIQIPASAISIDSFSIQIKVQFVNTGGTCTIEFDHPTIRRIS